MEHTEVSTDFSAALDAGAALTHVKLVGGVPILTVPQGYRVAELDHLLEAPTRHRGTTELFAAESFIRFINEFATVSGLAPRLYYQIDPKPSFTAILNDHGAAADWRDFRAIYAAPLSKEWLTWAESDKKPMKQEEFALFIERNLPDIRVPEAATMLEMAQTFQAKKNVDYASGTRLNNGQVQFKYEETIQAKAGEKGQFEIPDNIEIVIPVFDGSSVADRLVAKFRYRIDGSNKLLLWYELERPHKVLEAATDDLRKAIEEGTKLTAFHGKP